MTPRILRNATSAELYYSIASIKHQKHLVLFKIRNKRLEKAVFR